MQALDEEAIFSAVGLQRILDGKPALHKYLFERAAALPKVIRRRLLQFLATDAFAPAHDVGEFDYEATRDLVSQGQTPEQARALFLAVPDRELATDLGILAGKIVTWANGVLPREETPLVIGRRLEEPDPHSIADFRRLWHVALDPMSVLDDLDDGSLSDDQVVTLAKLYPAIYAEMRQAVTDTMATMGARRGKTWEPAPEKAALLGTLLQQETADPELTAAVQAMYAQQPQPNDPPAGPPPRRGGAKGSTADAGTEPTPGERAAGG